MEIRKSYFRTILVFIGLIGFVLLAVDMPRAENDKPGYIMEAGDIIEISVWNRPELKEKISIRPDGWISFPLVGELKASGIGPADLAEQLRQKLTQYLKDPGVSVNVVEYKSKNFLVIGEVKKPGLYQYEGGVTVFEAIGLAGGYEKHAQLKSVLLVRNGYSEIPSFYLLNLHNLIHDGDVSGNIELEPKDIVYLPKNFLGNVGDLLDYFLSRVKPAADTYFIYQAAKR